MNINHGFYPFALKYLHKKLREYQMKAKLNLDRWFRVELQIEIEER